MKTVFKVTFDQNSNDEFFNNSDHVNVIAKDGEDAIDKAKKYLLNSYKEAEVDHIPEFFVNSVSKLCEIDVE